MPRVLFWNVQGKQLDGYLLALIPEQQPDIVVLVECPPGAGLSAVMASTGLTSGDSNGRIALFTTPRVGAVREPHPDPTDRVAFWRVMWGTEDWLLVALHGPDRRNASDGTRGRFFRRIADHVRFLETHSGHRRTLALGDFNASPFEPSVLGADGLHALGVRRVRGEFDRAVRNTGRADFFYNPMWRMYGMSASGDAGTGTYYYRDGYDETEPFWHMLDQVVIRPEVADHLPADRLRILTAANGVPLLDATGLPDADTASDHLPIVFDLV